MLIAETEYKHQVETDIRPFHDVLLGLFFITIGMKLDWHVVVAALGAGAGAAADAGAVQVRAGHGAGARVRRGARRGAAHRPVPGAGRRVRLRAAGAGAATAACCREWLVNPVLASMVLSMLATPFIIMYSNRIVRAGGERLAAAVGADDDDRPQAINTEKHVIICGYGRCGQNLARMLEREGIPYMALDLDPDRVRQAAAAGETVVFGDAARLQSLMAAGLARASAVVVSYHDTPCALKILATRARMRRRCR